MHPNTYKLIEAFQSHTVRIFIDKCRLQETILLLFDAMFPVYAELDVQNTRNKLKESAAILNENIARLTDNVFAHEVIGSFFCKLPDIRERLYRDAHSYLRNDPAAKSLEEIIITYPGFFALAVHRVAHELHQLQVPLIPRLFSEYAHSKVGIDIHPGATIGEELFLDHATGIVIGETTQIGNKVKIYQGVTLGALYLEKKLSDVKRHPTVEDNVIIYANATILGGKTIIGHNSTIGGSAWLTQSVAPYSLVYNKVDVQVKTVKEFNKPNNYFI